MASCITFQCNSTRKIIMLIARPPPRRFVKKSASGETVAQPPRCVPGDCRPPLPSTRRGPEAPELSCQCTSYHCFGWCGRVPPPEQALCSARLRRCRHCAGSAARHRRLVSSPAAARGRRPLHELHLRPRAGGARGVPAPAARAVARGSHDRLHALLRRRRADHGQRDGVRAARVILLAIAYANGGISRSATVVAAYAGVRKHMHSLMGASVVLMCCVPRDREHARMDLPYGRPIRHVKTAMCAGANRTRAGRCWRSPRCFCSQPAWARPCARRAMRIGISRMGAAFDICAPPCVA